MRASELKKKIKDFAKNKGRITIPEIQVEFKLEYKDVAPVVYKLCEERFMWLKGGLEYKVCDSSYTMQERRERMQKAENDIIRVRESEEPDESLSSENDGEYDNKVSLNNYDENDRFVLEVIAYCIDHKEATVSEIKKALSSSYIKAYKAANWMVENGYAISEEIDEKHHYTAVISKQQYAKKFGIQVSEVVHQTYKDSEELIKKLIYILSSSQTAAKAAYRIFVKNREKALSKSYYAMVSPKFDMDRAISCVPDLENKVKGIISSASTDLTIFGREWRCDKHFELLCLEVMACIAGKDNTWRREDAVNEAAKQIAALAYTRQSNEARNVHSRVLYEFLDGSDEDYERLKKLLWE